MDLKKIILSVFCFCACLCLLAQKNFPVKISDFSPEFTAEIDLNQKDTIIIGAFEEFRPEFVLKVSDKKTKKILIEAYLSDFPEYLINEQNEAIANVKELPYGSQSVLIYEDFNFDGRADFAIMNGYYSCYGGPSFDIYLTHKKSFQYSESFSVLSNEYCGMFQTEPETKTIHTMTKSGCCWHQFSEFKVMNNEPKVVLIIEESYTANNFVEVTTIDYSDGKEVREIKNYFPLEVMESEIIFSFDLAKSGKKLLVYQTGKILNYALILNDEEIEFYFPQPDSHEKGDLTNDGNFTYDMDENTLSFKNTDAEYLIYETGDNVGIKVKTKGKTYNLKGLKSTVKGDLKELRKLNWDNILYDNF